MNNSANPPSSLKDDGTAYNVSQNAEEESINRRMQAIESLIACGTPEENLERGDVSEEAKFLQNPLYELGFLNIQVFSLERHGFYCRHIAIKFTSFYLNYCRFRKRSDIFDKATSRILKGALMLHRDSELQRKMIYNVHAGNVEESSLAHCACVFRPSYVTDILHEFSLVSNTLFSKVA